MKWHVLIRIDGPDDWSHPRLRALYFMLYDHPKSFINKPGGFTVSWPIQRGAGGEEHFIIVSCDDSELDELKALTKEIMQ